MIFVFPYISAQRLRNTQELWHQPSLSCSLIDFDFMLLDFYHNYVKETDDIVKSNFKKRLAQVKEQVFWGPIWNRRNFVATASSKHKFTHKDKSQGSVKSKCLSNVKPPRWQVNCYPTNREIHSQTLRLTFSIGKKDCNFSLWLQDAERRINTLG